MNTDRHAAGTFCWAELVVHDVARAKDFYSQMFGWTYLESALPDGSIYARAQIRGRDVGAMQQLQAREGDRTRWSLYVEVPDVDAAAAAVIAHKGAVISQPIEAMRYGRMAVCRDPGGSTFSLWQSREHTGFEVMDEHGAPCWFELASHDLTVASPFYAAVLGWNLKPSRNGDRPYLEAFVGDKNVGGMLLIDPAWGEIPTHWSHYLQVDDTRQSVALARSLGAKILVEPKLVARVGTMATLRDPQGGKINLITFEKR
ncbi:MAG: VOC family protein [Deltaproteobacteria bacterium]|nr:VOC family protein [Deltaproteobacteria bacterium]